VSPKFAIAWIRPFGEGAGVVRFTVMDGYFLSLGAARNYIKKHQLAGASVIEVLQRLEFKAVVHKARFVEDPQ